MQSNPSTFLVRLVAVLCFASMPLAVACNGGDDEDELGDHGDDEDPVGMPSGATCPDDAGMLTYEEFGKPFLEKYCTRCHSSELEGEARMGAPLEHDFDTLAGTLLVFEHVDEMAASGPDSTNTAMPKDGAKPTMAEREMLGQWLACEQGQ